MRSAALTLTLLAMALPASGQTRTFDPQTGEYVIRYFSDELGLDTVIRLLPPNRIAPNVLLDSVTSLPGGDLEYWYSLVNASTTISVQPIVIVEFACPPAASASVSGATSWSASIRGASSRLGGIPTCMYFERDRPGGVAPGQALSGFLVRTPYLPSIGTPIAWGPRPLLHWPDSGEHDASIHALVEEVNGRRGAWASGAATTTPFLAPELLDLDTLQGQLVAVCSDPLWIDDGVLCAQFSDSLDATGARLGISNYPGARFALAGLLDELDGARELTGPVTNNAYWLLSLNANAVRESIPDGIPLAQTDVCASGPAGSSVTFNVAANGGQLQQGAFTILLEGAGQTVACLSPWTMTLADVSVVDVTVTATSISAGFEIAGVTIVGGLDGDTVIAGPQTVATTRHDGVTGAVITFDLTTESSPQITLGSSADTYLKRGTPNKNQGTEDILRIRQDGRNRALIQVSDSDLASISGPILSARLEFDIVFNADNWGTEGRTIDAHRMLVPWAHFGATWRCADDSDTSDQSPDCDAAAWEMQSLTPSPFDGTPSGTLLVVRDMVGTVSIDVTADVQAILGGQTPNYGWIIKKTNEGQAGHIQIGSSETGSGPRLVIVQVN